MLPLPTGQVPQHAAAGSPSPPALAAAPGWSPPGPPMGGRRPAAAVAASAGLLVLVFSCATARPAQATSQRAPGRGEEAPVADLQWAIPSLAGAPGTFVSLPDPDAADALGGPQVACTAEQAFEASAAPVQQAAAAGRHHDALADPHLWGRDRLLSRAMIDPALGQVDRVTWEVSGAQLTWLTVTSAAALAGSLRPDCLRVLDDHASLGRRLVLVHTTYAGTVDIRLHWRRHANATGASRERATWTLARALSDEPASLCGFRRIHLPHASVALHHDDGAAYAACARGRLSRQPPAPS